MNPRSFVILGVLSLVLIVVLNVVLIAPNAPTSDDTEVCIQDTVVVSADEPNGTLVVDGVTLTYEEVEILQMGNILVKNGGRLILKNSCLVFSQLAPYQYRLTIENSSELKIESSSFVTKYPVSWYIDSSNVTLIDAPAFQCFVKARGESILSINGSQLSGVTLTDSCVMAAAGSKVGGTSMDALSIANLMNTGATSIHMADSAYLAGNTLSCDQLIISDESWCTITSLDSGELHLWGDSNASVVGGSVDNLGLYDSTSITITDCSVGYFLIRSSLFQALDLLSVGELECSHYSQVQITNCTMDTLSATDHASLFITDCAVGEILLTDWSSGEMRNTNLSSAIITFYSSWLLTEIEADYLECSREAVVNISNSWIYHLYSWGFNLTTWSYGSALHISDSSLHFLRVGWWTIGVMNNCVVEDASLYHYVIFNITHSNFTFLTFSTEAIGRLAFCDVSHLYTRNTIDVVFLNSTFSWRVEPDINTHQITSLPIGNVIFWQPVSNGSFDIISYNITVIHCFVEDLELSIGNGVICDVYESVFSRVEVSSGGVANLTNCECAWLIAYGDVTIGNCSIYEITAEANSICYSEDSQIGYLAVYSWSEWTASNCTFIGTYAGGYGPHIMFQGCTCDFIGLTGSGQTEIYGCVVREIRTYNYIQITAVDCVIDIWYNAYTDYPEVTAINCTLGTITATAHTTLTLVNCEIVYFGTRDYASTIAENCTFNQFVASNWAQVTLRGNFAWTQWISVTNDAVVFRMFEIHTIYANGTTCPLADYVVLTATNTTLYSCTTSFQGSDQFPMIFRQDNIAEFDDQYAISIDTPHLVGWHPFTVSSSQPMYILVEEKPSPPQPSARTTPEDLGTPQTTNEGEDETQSSGGEEYQTLTIKESNTFIILGFLTGYSVCVSAVIILKYPSPPRIIFSRRRNHEEM